MSARNGLTRYWIEFEATASDLPPGAGIGVGVTAIDRDDALRILKLELFSGQKTPSVRRWIDDIDIRTLDQNHVIPNMRPPIGRGIWFPMI